MDEMAYPESGGKRITPAVSRIAKEITYKSRK
jgi:hypothetical protein